MSHAVLLVICRISEGSRRDFSETRTAENDVENVGKGIHALKNRYTKLSAGKMLRTEGDGAGSERSNLLQHSTFVDGGVCMRTRVVESDGGIEYVVQSTKQWMFNPTPLLRSCHRLFVPTTSRHPIDRSTMYDDE